MTTTRSRTRLALAQNFIRDRALVERLILRSNLSPEDTVLEIGPGSGAITACLARRCHRVIAIERDPNLAARLGRRFTSSRVVTVHQADFLDAPLPAGDYKVFANIPFNITTAIVAKLTTGQDPPRDAYLVMQREAAEKFSGQPRESLASVLLKPLFDVSLFHHFRRDDFFPTPAVEVVMLHLHRRDLPLINSRDARLYRDLITLLFTSRHPTVYSTLSHLLPPNTLSRIQDHVRSQLDRRPTAIPFTDWLALFFAFRTHADRAAQRAITGAHSTLRRWQTGPAATHRTGGRGRHH